MGKDTPTHLLPDSRKHGPTIDYRLWAEEIEGIVVMVGNNCTHVTESLHKYERVFIKNSDGLTDHGRMCVDCYQKLRRANVAHVKGVWETT